jgi:hypothetical protein
VSYCNVFTAVPRVDFAFCCERFGDLAAAEILSRWLINTVVVTRVRMQIQVARQWFLWLDMVLGSGVVHSTVSPPRFTVVSWCVNGIDHE